MNARLAIVISVLVVVLAGCSNAGAAPSASAAPSVVPSTAAGGALTIYAAASLKGALEQAKVAYETAYPGPTLTISTDSSAALETQISRVRRPTSSCRPTRPTRRSSSMKGLADGDAGHVRQQPADDHHADRQPGRRDRAVRPWEVGRSGSSPPATRCRSPSTPRSSSRTSPRHRALLPTSRRRTRPTSRRRRTTSARCRTKIELGEGDGAIVYVTDAEASDKVATIDVPNAASTSRRAMPGSSSRHPANVDAAQRVPRLVRRPRRSGHPASFGFLPPAS